MFKNTSFKLIKYSTRSISTSTIARSHIGKAPLYFSKDVSLEMKVEDSIPSPLIDFYNSNNLDALREGKETELLIKGPLGQKNVKIHPFVNLNVEKELTEAGNKVLNVRVLDSKQSKQKAMWGTTRSLINNAIVGVTEGFTLPLRLSGVGYRAALEENNTKIGLKLGYSHPISVEIPDGITVTIPQPTKIILYGIDKQQLGQFAATIRRWREPEPYKLKGIFVGDEVIKQKEMKKKQK